MTIVATYRFQDQAIYINDFRVTIKNPDRQLDVSYKFKDFDRRMGLFLAGDIRLWRILIPHLENVMANVNLGNILDTDGPL